MAVVVVAPDSFKGSATSVQAARAIADGWLSVRPLDRVVELPMADGGEGTLDAFEAAVPRASRHRVEVCGPTPDSAAVITGWVELPPTVSRGHRIGVVELADAGGILRIARPDPLRAHTRGVGEVVAAALRAGVDELLIGLGGSCSTDGGAGLLRALGARITDEDGAPLPDGGAALERVARVDLTALPPAPRHGVRLLTDVDNPLLGRRGAAAVFGPQKGARPDQVELLDEALRVWSERLGVDPGLPGTGAAGGAAYGLTAWGGRIVSGGAEIASLIGLESAVRHADVVITGEGRFDEQTGSGKAPAVVLAAARRAFVESVVIAGSFASAPRDARGVSLVELAGSTSDAMTQARQWLRRAGARAAEQETHAPRGS